MIHICFLNVKETFDTWENFQDPIPIEYSREGISKGKEPPVCGFSFSLDPVGNASCP